MSAYKTPKVREDVAPAFIALLARAHHNGAEDFAADLAIGGANPDSLRFMADHWEGLDFSPANLADDLRDLAEAVEVGVA
jgi:hypothetical protein